MEIFGRCIGYLKKLKQRIVVSSFLCQERVNFPVEVFTYGYSVLVAVLNTIPNASPSSKLSPSSRM